MIKFRVERHGERGDLGPNGEYGIVVVGRDVDTDYQTGETIHCPETHTHGPTCVQTLMVAREKDAEGNDIPGTSKREMIEKRVAAYKAEQARPVGTSSWPQKTVTDERGKTRQVDDLSITLR